MHQTLLQFPEIKLQRRDGHKLRGYFANQFGEESDHFHNHSPNGKSIQRYPLIQYKIVDGCPSILGIEEGARLLTDRFLRIDQIDIDGQNIPIHQKTIKSQETIVGVVNELFEYEFVNPWMPLNDENFLKYNAITKEGDRIDLLQRLLTGNMLHLFTAVSYREEERILVKTHLQPLTVKFKNQNMLAFKGRFITNVQVPDLIGFGKSASRGFGTIQRIK